VIQASRYVPYAFARDNAILLVPKTERDAEAWISNATPLAALNEVMRVFPGKVRPVVVETVKLTEARAGRHSRSSATSKASSTSRG
jgi:16S rRNA G1207 methylase RsmC